MAHNQQQAGLEPGLLIANGVAYFDFRFGSRWLSALPAADLAALLWRPSCSTLLAVFATLALVGFFGTFLTSFPVV